MLLSLLERDFDDMKNIALLVLAVPILVVVVGCAQLVPAREPLPPLESIIQPSAEPAAAPVTISARTLDYSIDYVDVDITYPEISGMRDETVQNAINERVFNDLKSRAQAIEAQAEQDARESRLRIKYSMDAGFSVARNDGRVLSIQIEISTYQGGANVGTDSMFINMINKEEAIQPTFSELFVDGADYTAVINEIINAQIVNIPESEMFDFQTVSPDQWYYLTDTALVVVFPRYAITPGVYGEPEFVIPFDEISDILIPDVK